MYILELSGRVAMESFHLCKQIQFQYLNSSHGQDRLFHEHDEGNEEWIQNFTRGHFCRYPVQGMQGRTGNEN